MEQAGLHGISAGDFGVAIISTGASSVVVISAGDSGVAVISAGDCHQRGACKLPMGLAPWTTEPEVY